jgi:hypothetical protein
VIPPVRVAEIPVPQPARVSEMIRDLEVELFTLLDSGYELEALQKSTLAMKLRQIAGGAVYTNPECTEWEEVHPEKINALSNALDELQGEPALIFYWFAHERERIAAMLTRTGRTFADISDEGAKDRWNARELDAALAHPQSAGYGLNLQHGGSHAIWFSIPWPYDPWKQANGRLARPGQRAPWVTASCLLCGDTDRRVLESLRWKQGQEESLYDSLLVRDLL